jgi:hypothetical protein
MAINRPRRIVASARRQPAAPPRRLYAASATRRSLTGCAFFASTGRGGGPWSHQVTAGCHPRPECAALLCLMLPSDNQHIVNAAKRHLFRRGAGAIREFPFVAIRLYQWVNRIFQPMRLSIGSPRHETAPCGDACAGDQPGGRKSRRPQCRLSLKSAARLIVQFFAAFHPCLYPPPACLAAGSGHAALYCHDCLFPF